jgi:imidazolonepropionase-like amidohydrolase
MVKEAGFSPMEAIHAATMGAARLLRQANEIGSLEPGKQADIIAVRENPLQDPAALRDVQFVMKAGRLHKQNGIPVPFF